MVGIPSVTNAFKIMETWGPGLLLHKAIGVLPIVVITIGKANTKRTVV